MALIDNIINYYSLNETSGAVIDSVGNNNGTNNDATTNQTGNASGNLGTAYDFDGTNDWVSLGTYDPFSTTTFSISFWINPDVDTKDMWFVSKRDSPSNVDSRWGIFYETGSSQIRYQGEAAGTTESTGQDITTGSWQHVVLTSDGTDSRVYFNGSLVHTGGAITLGTDTASNYAIASVQSGAGLVDGKMQAIGVWSGKKLSLTEVQEVYNSGDGKAYPFSVTETKTSTGNSRIAVPTQKTETGIARIQVNDQEITKTGTARIQIDDVEEVYDGIARLEKSFTKTETGTARLEILDNQKTSTGNASLKLRKQKTSDGDARIEILDNQILKTGAAYISPSRIITKQGTARIEVPDIEITKTGTTRIEVSDNEKTSDGDARIEILDNQITKTGNASIKFLPQQITKTGNASIGLTDDFKPVVKAINLTKPTFRSAETFN